MPVSDEGPFDAFSKSEIKSRGSTTGRSLRLSSIDGWSNDKLPKILIVCTFEKISSDGFPSHSRPGKLTKRRDLSGNISEFEVFYIDSPEYIVPWDDSPNHAELVKKRWTNEWIARLKEKTTALNQIYSDRPIQFQSSFKNGPYLRLQYGVNNYRDLPKCPPSVMKYISTELDYLIGCEFRLYKDHSVYWGPRGWFDNEIAFWEHENRKKSPGKLWYRIPGQDWERLDAFTEGRQDYWLGWAVEDLMTDLLSKFEDAGGHETGLDHRINFEED
tara:strand:+ start:3184 stop:4002 length:819 start_codon:yes stop_codon:yes gene_type:complete